MSEPKMKIRFLQDREVRDHNGTVIDQFRAGQVKELAHASARHWLNRGIAVEIMGKGASAAAVPEGRPEKPTGAALVSQIVGVIEALDPNEDFTQAGIPSLGALERALGYAVTSAEREDAWQAHLAADEAAAKNKAADDSKAGGKGGGKTGPLV